MAVTYCRLCLSREKLLDIFDPELTNSGQLRMCILLCTGVNILPNDLVTKYVCHTCCEISIKLFKFRKNALANDRALKDIFKEQDTMPVTDVNSIALFNEFLVRKTAVRIRYGDELKKKLPMARRTKRYAVHPSVFKLMKRYTNMKLPQELLSANCDPKVYAENVDVAKLKSIKEELKATTVVNSDIDIFKQRFPGVSIVKLSGDEKPIEKEPTTEPREETKSVSVSSEKEKVVDEEAKEEDETMLKRKRALQDEDKESKKAKIVHEPLVNLKIPEPTSKIKDFLEGLQDGSGGEHKVNNEVLASDGRDHQPSTLPSTTPEIPKKDLAPAEDDGNLENLEICKYLTSDTPTKSQALQSECAASSSAENEGDATKKVLRPRKSRPSFFAEDVIFDDSDDDYIPEPEPEGDDDDMDVRPNWSLLETVEEEMAFTCDICNKMFNHLTKLKLHKRMHKNCIVCKKTFISQKALNLHLNEICYKRVIKNQPVLCLRRCDADDGDDRSSEASVESNFEVLCISDDEEPQPTVDQQQAKEHQIGLKEQHRLRQIFEKYHNKLPPYHKVASCQEDAQLFKASMGKGQATMTNMYPILKYFRVPVVLKAADVMSVEMTEKTADYTQLTNSTSDWSGHPVKNVSYMTNAKTIGVRQIAPKPTTSTQQQEASNALRQIAPKPGTSTQQQETAKTPTNNPLSRLSLKGMLEGTPSANPTPKVRQTHTQQKGAATTATTSNTQPVILNNLQSGRYQNTQPVLLNNLSNDRIFTLLPPQPKIQNVLSTQPQPVIQPQYTIQAQRPLPAVIPKTYTAKPRPQPVYQTVQAQNMIPQMQNVVSQPQTITIQHPPTQTYIQSAGGYVLSTGQNTFTPSANQNAFTPIHQTAYNAINHATTVHQQSAINPRHTFTVAKQNILTGANVNAYRGSNANALIQNRASTAQSSEPKASSIKVVITSKCPTPAPKNKISNVAYAAQQQQQQSIQNALPQQPQVVQASRQLLTTETKVGGEGGSQNRPKTVPAKTTSGEAVANYLRVKAPWELNGV